MFNKEELNQLYRYALSLSAHEPTAYDLVQSGVERYLNKISAMSELPKNQLENPLGSPIENPLAYIKSTIRNCYFDLERHRKVVSIISIDGDDASNMDDYIGLVDSDPMEDVLINQQEVEQLLASLNAQENELLYLWAVEEHTVEEISRIYAKPRGTMLSKLHRLKKRIREQLQVASVSANEKGSQ